MITEAKKRTKPDVYAMITERIVSMLDSGTVPWRKPWNAAAGGMPSNLKSGKAYRGINVLILALQSMAKGYDSPYWVTFKQSKGLKASVRKGEKSTPVVFFKWFETTDNDTGAAKRVPLLRYYNVFNTEQVDDLKPGAADPIQAPFDPIASAEAVVELWGDKPIFGNGNGKAYYSPARDYIGMPKRESFDGASEYYSTLFHECVHATGGLQRLNRPEVAEVGAFGDEPYSREELVAEFGAAYLCSVCGIENTKTIENSAAYIANWRRKLSDPTNAKWIVNGAAAAQKAADYILGRPAFTSEGSR